MKVGTWVQFENETTPLGTIISKNNMKYQVKTSKLGRCSAKLLEFDVDGYATEYERKNKINRIIEFQA
jgi:hypothetical protein